MKFKSILLQILFPLALFCSCEVTDLDKLDSPNAVTPEQAEVGLLLNNVQYQFSVFLDEANERPMEVIRMTTMDSRPYSAAYAPQNFNNTWRYAYQRVLNNSALAISLSGDNADNKSSIGVAKIFNAYTFLTLVDIFGDVPYSEALGGAENPNPKADKASDIYNKLLIVLDEAIEDLTAAQTTIYQDLFYSSNEQWIKLANSIKLKIYLQRRLVPESSDADAVDAIVSSGDYIATPADDFVFQYSTTTSSPDSRHPEFVENYDGASVFIGNGYMNYLLKHKSFIDPRIRYYLYRQTTDAADFNSQNTNCIGKQKPVTYTNPIFPFCELDSVYWGRDHGDNSGIPPNNKLRTVWGAYPFGGNFDADQGTGATLGDGGKGAGIIPIILSSYVNFYLAEMYSARGNDVGALEKLKLAVSQSLMKVKGFPGKIGELAHNTSYDVVPDADYITAVTTAYTSAASVDEKVEVIATEFYLASFGNGIEAYNSYRRTGYPELQPLSEASVDTEEFLNTFPYPAEYSNLNTNAAKKEHGTKVFWAVPNNKKLK